MKALELFPRENDVSILLVRAETPSGACLRRHRCGAVARARACVCMCMCVRISGTRLPRVVSTNRRRRRRKGQRKEETGRSSTLRPIVVSLVRTHASVYHSRRRSLIRGRGQLKGILRLCTGARITDATSLARARTHARSLAPPRRSFYRRVRAIASLPSVSCNECFSAVRDALSDASIIGGCRVCCVSLSLSLVPWLPSVSERRFGGGGRAEFSTSTSIAPRGRVPRHAR